MTLKILVLPWNRRKHVSWFWLGTGANMCLGSGLEQAQTCGGIKQVNAIPIPLDNRISNRNTCINKR